MRCYIILDLLRFKCVIWTLTCFINSVHCTYSSRPKLLLCVFSETADMSQSLEDKLKAIRVWMTDTDEAVSSQDSLQSTQALLPDEIDMIYSSFMEVSWEVMTALSFSLNNSLTLTPSYLGAWCYAYET